MEVSVKNKQEIFKQGTKNNNILSIDGDDDFEEVVYSRPESKVERPMSRNKDSKLKASSKI